MIAGRVANVSSVPHSAHVMDVCYTPNVTVLVTVTRIQTLLHLKSSCVALANLPKMYVAYFFDL